MTSARTYLDRIDVVVATCLAVASFILLGMASVTWYWYDWDTVFVANNLTYDHGWLWGWLTVNLTNLVVTGTYAAGYPWPFSPFEFMLWLSSAFDAASLALCYLLNKKLAGSRSWGIVGALFLAFNWSFVLAAKSGSNKAIVSFFTLLFLLVVVNARERDELGGKHLVVVGVALGLAISAHATNVFLVPVTLLALKDSKISLGNGNSGTPERQGPPNANRRWRVRIKEFFHGPGARGAAVLGASSAATFFALLLTTLFVKYGGRAWLKLFSLELRTFFQPVHRTYFEWAGSPWPISFRRHVNVWVDFWRGAAGSLYGVDPHPASREYLLLALHLLLVFVPLLLAGAVRLSRKHSWFLLLFVENLAWAFVYESYEPERWTWLALLFPTLLVAGIRSVTRRDGLGGVASKSRETSLPSETTTSSGPRGVASQEPAIRVPSNPASHSRSSKPLAFLLVALVSFVPVAAQSPNHVQFGPEVYAFRELQAAVDRHPDYDPLIITPVPLGGTYTFGMGVVYFTNLTTFQFRYDNYIVSRADLVLLSLRENQRFFVVIYYPEIKDVLLEQFADYFELGDAPVLSSELGDFYLCNFTDFEL